MLGRRVHVGDDQGAHAAPERTRGGGLRLRSNCRPMSRQRPCRRRRAAFGTIRTCLRPQDPVAVFDSGVGGLTVLHELLVVASDRGLHLSRRHGAVSLRRADPRSSRRTRSRSPTTCSTRGREAARGGMQRGELGGVRRRSRLTSGGRPGYGRDRRGRPGHPARGGRQPHRPGGAPGDPGDGRQRGIRASGRGCRPSRSRRERRVSRPGADHPERVLRGPGRGRDRARLLRAVAGGGRRHGDPRLHALPARGSAPAADPRARGHPRHLGHGRRPRGSSAR